MGKDKKDEVFSNMDGYDLTYKEETTEKVELIRKKFHYEGGRWFCNICNDIGREKGDKLVCQGCQSSE